MGMGRGLFLLVQTPLSAQRSRDTRVVIGAGDMARTRITNLCEV